MTYKTREQEINDSREDRRAMATAIQAGCSVAGLVVGIGLALVQPGIGLVLIGLFAANLWACCVALANNDNY